MALSGLLSFAVVNFFSILFSCLLMLHISFRLMKTFIVIVAVYWELSKTFGIASEDLRPYIVIFVIFTIIPYIESIISLDKLSHFQYYTFPYFLL